MRQRYKNCESILNFVDFYSSGDTFFLVFDKMAGGDLAYVFESTPYLSESQASRVTGAVSRALLTLHSDGVAHRDLKPENILCHSPREINPVVLCDFGLASDPPSRRDPSDWDITQNSTLSVEFCGTYLGVLLFEMLFDRLPFNGDCGRHGQSKDPNCRNCHKNVLPKVCKGNYVIPNTRKSVSDSDTAVDLIRRLLVVDPQTRYSAADVLKHPFVTAHRNDDVTRTDCVTTLP
ncbi:MAP kinase-interacting serine/threonine-protein kinase 1-like [Aplysia californica]|uniref:MAP kinase-interacting serine/threonine-protein kinase 1-like n=1 Tax=Aplysia californica TaxID=6500 RepID=A0ABM1VXA7_APLCA|nr:MAP kinase-interacting serine/threonine-protein kinase 1-like [Aplysia californica]